MQSFCYTHHVTRAAQPMTSPFNERHAAAIATRIRFHLDEAAQTWGNVSSWAPETFARLAEFTCRGKLIRGQLVLLGAALAGRRPSRVVLDCAAAMELFHSSILIHDDLIDHDELRRGAPAMHVQMAAALRARGEHHHAVDRGSSLAICVADCGFFLTFLILGKLAVPDHLRHTLLKLWAEEFALVCLAEMDDIHLSPGATPAPRDAIWRVYYYKTARYTFRLPLMTGLLLGGAPAPLRRAVVKYAEHLGLLFQLKDDQLGLFGSPAQTGKPVGSDILQNKKTLYHHYLLTCTPLHTRAKLQQIFSAASLTSADVAFVQNAARESGIEATLQQTAARLASQARRTAARLPVHASLRAQLLKLVDYSEARAR